jgi:hypothetical protein
MANFHHFGVVMRLQTRARGASGLAAMPLRRSNAIGYHPLMRRILAFVLMLLVPLQLAWSAVEAIPGHVDQDVSASGYHVHQHHDRGMQASPAPGDPGAIALGAPGGNHHDGVSHGDEGTQAGHFHPVLCFIAFEPVVNVGSAPPGEAPSRPADSFISHIPPLFDWPPAARALCRQA